ncbi:hypothetical protein [Nitrosomonas sp. PY1]|uniref:hypothetical protein n=1 Tax=Nitrosomonas sp. PY1 TaxID=1803906 RepID=UPI001FC8A8DD|nr:hypothetical protein [Nitrosomonas sp. PY1]
MGKISFSANSVMPWMSKTGPPSPTLLEASRNSFVSSGLRYFDRLGVLLSMTAHPPKLRNPDNAVRIIALVTRFQSSQTSCHGEH